MQIRELIATLLQKPRQPQFPALPVQLEEIQWLLKREERLAKSNDKGAGARH
jgi:hypothetical protein